MPVESGFSVEALGVSVPVVGLDASLLSVFPIGPATGSAPGAGDPLDDLARFTRSALERTDLLCVHAGVVSVPGGGAIAFPGRSGLGKSTLTAALVRAGFEYLSDEVLALRPDGRVSAFPRPVALDTAAVTMLGLADMVVIRGADEMLIAADALGSVGPAVAPLVELLLLERRPGPALLMPAPRSEAVAALVEHSFNHYRDPQASLAQFVRLVACARVRRAAYSDAAELAQLLAAEICQGR